MEYFTVSNFVDKTGQLQPRFIAVGERCPSSEGWIVDVQARGSLTALYGSIIFLALLCLVLHVRTAIFKPRRMLQAYRDVLTDDASRLRRSSFQAEAIDTAVNNSHIEMAPGIRVPAELQFFNLWNVMTIAANTLQIASSVICILDMNLNGGYVPIEWAVLIVGTTAMITWVNLVQVRTIHSFSLFALN